MEIITGSIFFYNIWPKIKNNSFHPARIASDDIQNPNPCAPDVTALLRASPSPGLAMATHCSRLDYWLFQPGCLEDDGSCDSPAMALCGMQYRRIVLTLTLALLYVPDNFYKLVPTGGRHASSCS